MFQSIIRDVGFVILCPERNLGGLRATALCCRNQGVECRCVVGSDATDAEVSDLSAYCEVSKGGRTITSLLNEGIKTAKSEWVVFVMAGGVIRPDSLRKYRYFAKSARDILFPVVDRKYRFHEASISGLMLHRRAIEEVGSFEEDHDLSVAKSKWSATAVGRGYAFKAIVGAKFF